MVIEAPKIDDYTNVPWVITLAHAGELTQDRISNIELLRDNSSTLKIIEGILEGSELDRVSDETLQIVTRILNQNLFLKWDKDIISTLDIANYHLNELRENEK